METLINLIDVLLIVFGVCAVLLILSEANEWQKMRVRFKVATIGTFFVADVLILIAIVLN